MSKAFFISIAFIAYGILTSAQHLTEAEVSAKMYESISLDKANRTVEALESYLIVGKNTEMQCTEAERQVYVCSQTLACMCYEKLKRYEEACLLAKKLLAGNLSESERSDVGKLYATNGCFYASELMGKESADNSKARSILMDVVPYADGKVKELVLRQIPTTWLYEGIWHLEAQRTGQALACLEQAAVGFRELGDSKGEISVLKDIGNVKSMLYDVEGAQDAYRKAWAQARQTNAVESQMTVLNELWKIGNSTGNVRMAQECAASMDSLVEASAGLNVKIGYYNQKGDEAKRHTQYGIAEQWYLRAENIAGRLPSTGSPTAARHTAYANLRNLYAAMGRFDDALLYARKALAEYQTYTPKDDPTYNMPYMALADIYRLMGDKENCYRSLEKLFGTASPTSSPKALYPLYVTRGRCRFHFKDYRQAMEDYSQADRLLAAGYPPTDGDRVALQALLGATQHQLGCYAESEQCYRNYAELTKSLYGDNSLESINAQIYLANAEGFAGHTSDGCKDYTLAVRRMRMYVKQRIPYMGATERESLWSPLSSLFTNMTPFALEAGQTQTAFTRSCYDALVMSKAFLLDSERSMYDVVKRKGTAADMRDYLSLSEMKNRVKIWEKDIDANADSILSVSSKVVGMETQLAARCQGYTDGTGFIDVDCDLVRQSLGRNDVLVDFADYTSASQGRKYAAYIIKGEQDFPLLTPLFAERQIDSLGISRPDMYYGEDYAQDIVRLLWNPIKDNVPDGATVYYVPSQLLFKVSLESLPMADGSLLGDHYNFVRLSSARELVGMKRRARKTASHTATLYGGLQYDLDATAMADEAKKYDISDLFAMRGDVVRGDSVFLELKGSMEEVMKIDRILEEKNWQVKPYTGGEGTEESFFSMHGRSPQILHIATHGFFYTPAEAQDVDFLKGYTDAMSLSGLVLSGGNAAWQGKPLPKGVLGGILTANEIARLDLDNTDMVVLSACKTAQGKVTAEGLYGLQRAFKKAGVQTIVMSLWSVSDKTTSEFMTTFYERLCDPANAWDKRKAFAEAREVIRKKHPDPFHWAAFVMLD